MWTASGTGVRSSRHMPPCLTAQRNPSTPFLRRKDKSPGQPDPRKPTPSGLGFQTCALSSGPCPGALLCNFFEGVFRPWSNFFDLAFWNETKKEQSGISQTALTYPFSIFLLPGGPLSKLLVATISLPRLGFSSSRYPLLLLPKLGSGRSRSQTADPARPGTSQTRSPQMPWRSHGSPGRYRGGSHAH